MNYLEYQSDFLTAMIDVKRILIVVAMDCEKEALLKNRKTKEIILGEKNKLLLNIINFKNCEVLIAQSGIGLVNGGILLNQIIEHYDLDAIIQLGVGGALDERLEIGDVVIAKNILQHDSLTTTDRGNLFIAPGELTLSASDKNQVNPLMRTDKVLRAWLVGLLSDSESTFYQGTLLSGSEFVANKERKKELKNLHHEALMVDMEAAAFAQIARKQQISFISAKTVADRARPEKSISQEFTDFLEAANRHSKKVFDSLCEIFS